MISPLKNHPALSTASLNDQLRDDQSSERSACSMICSALVDHGRSKIISALQSAPLDDQRARCSAPLDDLPRSV
jgi:hypothetical protein